jgi:hypothetical protein
LTLLDTSDRDIQFRVGDRLPGRVVDESELAELVR